MWWINRLPTTNASRGCLAYAKILTRYWRLKLLRVGSDQASLEFIAPHAWSSDQHQRPVNSRSRV